MAKMTTKQNLTLSFNFQTQNQSKLRNPTYWLVKYSKIDWLIFNRLFQLKCSYVFRGVNSFLKLGGGQLPPYPPLLLTPTVLFFLWNRNEISCKTRKSNEEYLSHFGLLQSLFHRQSLAHLSFFYVGFFFTKITVSNQNSCFLDCLVYKMKNIQKHA